jgi:CBS-domain-containing membrane protein
MRNMREAPIARDCLNQKVPVVSPGNDAFEAIRILLKSKSAGALVIDQRQGVVGIFGEKNAIRVLANASYDRQLGGTVGEFMEPAPESLSPDTDLFIVAQRFMEGDLPLMPVIDNGEILGAVTRRDLLEAIEALQGLQVAMEGAWDHHVKTVMDPESKEEMQPYLADAPPEQRAESFRNRKTLQARNEPERDLPK